MSHRASAVASNSLVHTYVFWCLVKDILLHVLPVGNKTITTTNTTTTTAATIVTSELPTTTSYYYLLLPLLPPLPPPLLLLLLPLLLPPPPPPPPTTPPTPPPPPTTTTTATHDVVIKWKHFPRYWHFVLGINRSPVNSPQKGQWRGALIFSLICARINGWANNGDARDLRRHLAHYDVIVMTNSNSNSNNTNTTCRLFCDLCQCLWSGPQILITLHSLTTGKLQFVCH